MSVGITVDSYIVYFERLKDETRTGRTVRTSVDRAFKGAWRTVLAADRSFTITITGEPNSFTVSFGIGRWLQNLSVAALEGMAIGPAVFVAEVPISLWDYDIEREFWSFVEQQVELKV